MSNLPTTTKTATIRDLLIRSKEQITMALPKHMTPDRLLRIAMTTIQKTPLLLDCDPKSLVGAVMESAQLGLEPDGILGHAYLIPFRFKDRGYQAQLMVGYKGLISLARRSGQVISIAAHVVRENDDFYYCYGLEEKLHHVPAPNNRGKTTHVYAVAQLRDGGHAFDVMSFAEVEEIRESSKAKDTGPWRTHWDEMARKTAVRRLAKYLPLSTEFQRAAAIDEYANAGITQQVDIQPILEDVSERTEQKVTELKDKLKKKRKPRNKEPGAGFTKEELQESAELMAKRRDGEEPPHAASYVPKIADEIAELAFDKLGWTGEKLVQSMLARGYKIPEKMTSEQIQEYCKYLSQLFEQKNKPEDE